MEALRIHLEMQGLWQDATRLEGHFFNIPDFINLFTTRDRDQVINELVGRYNFTPAAAFIIFEHQANNLN